MDAGTSPLLAYTASPQDAVDRLVAELAALTADARIPLSALLVIYGDNVNRLMLHDRLVRRFGADRVWWLNERDQKKEPPEGYGRDYLRMVYVDTATGLEACAVFLLGVEDLFFTGEVPRLDEDEIEELREERARKLYMAMTRAGQKLVVLASQPLPREVEALFETVPSA
jgi:superfamily I DNA/RNA helicase